MKIVTTMVEEEVYEAINENGNRLSIDMRNAELKKAQSPTELLLSAVAACGAVDIVMMLKKRRKTIQKFTIETTGQRREDHPRSFTNIHCKYILESPDVNEEEFSKAAALSLEKYCSVATSLKSTVTHEVEIIR
jgi:putative redox protein